MTESLPVLDETRCTGCGDCVMVCPAACLAMSGPTPWLPRPLDCVFCAYAFASVLATRYGCNNTPSLKRKGRFRSNPSLTLQARCDPFTPPSRSSSFPSP